MKPKVLLTKIFRNQAFASAHRRAGLAKLAEIADLVDYDSDLTGDMADGVVGVIATPASCTVSSTRAPPICASSPAGGSATTRCRSRRPPSSAFR